LATGAAAQSLEGFTITGDALAAGTLYLMIAGKSLQIGIDKGDSDKAIALKIVSGINSDTNLPVNAKINESEEQTVTITASFKGVLSNDIDLRANYYVGQDFPKGVLVTCGVMTDGAGTPDMLAIVASLGDEWFNHIICPYNDKESLDILRDELNIRWGALKMIEGICYTSFRGNHSQTSTWGASRNDHLITCIGSNLSPNPSYEWAAAYGAVAAYNLSIDPARPLQTLPLVGLKPAIKAIRWDMTERNLHLHDGVATHGVDAGDQVLIEREISTYQTNAFGSPDPSYLDITTPATLGYFRYAMKTAVTQRYPRHKLAGDDVLEFLDSGQPVVTPQGIRTLFLEKYEEMIAKGLMEDFDGYKQSLSVEISKDDKSRINVLCAPDVINGLRILAATTAFKL
jgi:phage tail sheath gpL-like